MLMMVLVIGLGQRVRKIVSWSGQRNVVIVARIAKVSMEEEEHELWNVKHDIAYMDQRVVASLVLGERDIVG